MKAIAFHLLGILGILAIAIDAAEPAWKRWPADAEQVFGSTIGLPPTFIIVAPHVPAKADMLLNGRFQSKDASVEFAVTIMDARSMGKSIADRSIPLPLAAGEKTVKRTHTTKPVTTEGVSYVVYDEFITVEGPAKNYTRFFHRSLSTSRLPGASSVLWELKLMKGASLAAYQPSYARFKASLEMGEH